VAKFPRFGRQNNGIITTAADSITYLCTALPVLLPFFLIDFTYRVYAVTALVRRRQAMPLAFCGAALVIWLMTSEIDSYIAWISGGNVALV
jgi:hypothetical protein